MEVEKEEEIKIILTMTEEEASLLLGVLQCMSNIPDYKMPSVIYNLYEKLHAHGINPKG